MYIKHQSIVWKKKIYIYICMYVCMYVCILRHPYVALKVEIILGFLSNHKRTSLSSFHGQSQGLEQMLEC